MTYRTSWEKSWHIASICGPADSGQTVSVPSNVCKCKGQGQTPPLWAHSGKEKVQASSHGTSHCLLLCVNHSRFVKDRQWMCVKTPQILLCPEIRRRSPCKHPGSPCRSRSTDVMLGCGSLRQDHQAACFIATAPTPAPTLGWGACPEAFRSFFTQILLEKWQDPGLCSKPQVEVSSWKWERTTLSWMEALRWCCMQTGWPGHRAPGSSVRELMGILCTLSEVQNVIFTGGIQVSW